MIELDDLEARFAERRALGLRRGLEITNQGAPARRRACAVSPHVLDVLGKAIGLWKGGEKFPAQLHLTYARLPPLTEGQAFALCAAVELLKEGMPPRARC